MLRTDVVICAISVSNSGLQYGLSELVVSGVLSQAGSGACDFSD
jgi:hypothetical protein